MRSFKNKINLLILGMLVLSHIAFSSEIGEEAVVLSGNAFLTPPVSVYNSVNDEILTIWANPKSGCANNVELVGQKSDPETGAKIGNVFTIHSISGSCPSSQVSTEIPAISYDPVNNQYFVVLKTRTTSARKVIGFLINDDGVKTSSVIEFESNTFGDPFNHLLVDFDPTLNKFIAGYHLQTGSDMALHLHKINPSNGQTEGSELIIDKNSLNSDFSGNKGLHSSEIIYNVDLQKFFLVFYSEDLLTSEIWGNIIDPTTMGLEGSFFRIGPDAISETYKNPVITYNSADSEFLVVFEKIFSPGSGFEQVREIYGQKISASDGSNIGSNEIVSEIPGCPNPVTCSQQAKLPIVRFSPVKNEYMASFFGIIATSGSENYDLFASRLSTSDLSIIDGESFSMVPEVGTSVDDNDNLLPHNILYFEETDKFFYTWINQQTNEVTTQLRKYQNHAPTDFTLDGNSIDENLTTGSIIGTLNTEDLDEDDTHSYLLVAGEGDADNGSFDIVNNELRSDVVFDFEEGNEKSIRIRSIDSFGESVERSFTIHIIDINENPVDISLDNNTIQEFRPIGTHIGNLSTIDPDFDSSHSYEIVSGDEYFQVEANELKTNSVLEYSESSKLTVTIKAIDSEGLEFEKEFTITIEEYPDFTEPVISNQSFKETYLYSKSSEQVSITARDDHGIDKVTLHFKGIADSDWSTLNVESDDSVFIADITRVMLDELGITYYFEVSDIKYSTYSDTTLMTLTFQEGDISLNNLLYGGQEKDYQIIAIPYQLENNSVSNIFVDDLGAQSSSSWRLLSYEDGTCCKEYPNSMSSIARGKGYWFNQKENHGISIGSGRVDYDPEVEYFEILLNAGWNQIGNPYPFDINWADVVESELNGDVFNTGKVSNSLIQYKNGSFVTDGILKAMTGAFISAEESVTIYVPLKKAGTSGGGRIAESMENKPIDEEQWIVPIQLTTNENTYSLGAVGMHPEASFSKDAWDELLIPRFGNYVDYSFEHTEYFYNKFARDIVPTSQNHIWQFTASARDGGTAQLKWNNDYFGRGNKQLLLVDLQTGMTTDMSKGNSYDFNLNEDKRFELVFGDHEFIQDYLSKIEVSAGVPYPNPFNYELNIPIILPSNEEGFDVDLEIYNSQGLRIYQKNYQEINSNLHRITWDGENYSGEFTNSGIYVYKVTINNTGKTFSGKVVKK